MLYHIPRALSWGGLHLRMPDRDWIGAVEEHVDTTALSFVDRTFAARQVLDCYLRQGPQSGNVRTLLLRSRFVELVVSAVLLLDDLWRTLDCRLSAPIMELLRKLVLPLGSTGRP